MFCLPGLAVGQAQAIFKKLSLPEGLSNGRVTSMVKGSDGFVWIGTKNGLNRFDGAEVRIYNKQNSALPSNDIADLLVDRRGDLWVATLGGGIAHYSAQTDDFKVHKNRPKRPESLASNLVNTFLEDSQGRLWVGTESGLSLYDAATGFFRSFSHVHRDPNSLSHNSVTSLAEGPDGMLWIGTFGGGLNKFDPESERFFPVKDQPLQASFIYCLARISDEHLLIGSGGDGLLALHFPTGRLSRFMEGESPLVAGLKIVRSLFKDRQGGIWIGTDGNGLVKVQRAGSGEADVLHYQHNARVNTSLSGNAVYEIMDDDDGHVWIGTAWNGINILNTNTPFEFFFSDLTGDAPFPVLSIYQSQQQVYLGLDGHGLTQWDTKDQSVRYFNQAGNTSLGGEYIQFITGHQGNIWMGTFANGLICFSPEKGKLAQYTYQPDNPRSLSYNDVRYIMPDRAGNLWVATWGGGLNYLDLATGKFTRFQASETGVSSVISSDNVLALQPEGDRIWVATFGGGLDLFDPKTRQFTNFSYQEHNANSLSSNNILSILRDSKGYLWIGTSGEGVNRFHLPTQRFERFEEAQELAFSTVTAMIEDDAGDIWFSTKKGIYKYEYASEKFLNMPPLDGEYHINSVFKDAQGRLYFGGTHGMYRFHPQQMQVLHTKATVRLTGFKLFNQEVPIEPGGVLTQQITFMPRIALKHYQNVMTFEFTALKFPFSTETEFAIQMENFDEDWRNIGKARSATFTNLSPGLYTFKVKSRQPGQPWDEQVASVDVWIEKPLWRQDWAIASYIVLCLAILYMARKYTVAWERMKANLKLEKLSHEKDIELYHLKQQFFTNVSHEIRTPVTLILSAVNRLLNDRAGLGDTHQDALQILRTNGGRLLQLINELLDFKRFETHHIRLKVTENNWTAFCQEIYLSFTELALQKKIKFEWEGGKPETMVWFDGSQMEKVVYNLLSNAFKFTHEGGRIRMTLTEDGEHVQLIVSDTGVGMAGNSLTKIFHRFYQTETAQEMKEAGFGLGLSITKEIVDLHQGEIWATSEKGRGSTFTVRLRKGRAHFPPAALAAAPSLPDPLIGGAAEADSLQQALDQEGILREKCLLLVEDNPDIRQYLVRLLEGHCQLLEAENGQQGLELAEKHLPDLIVSDIMMPIMDGIALARTLKRDPRTNHIPIILLTARTALMHQMEGLHTGADDYVTKPFNEALLLGKIINLIKNRQLLQEKFQSVGLISPDRLPAPPNDRQFLKSLISAIETHLDSPTLSAEVVAKHVGMSHSVLYKKLKAITGMTYVEFVQNYRLELAYKLLTESQLTVAEASDKVGYADPKYFSKLFKQKFGKNPSELR